MPSGIFNPLCICSASAFFNKSDDHISHAAGGWAMNHNANSASPQCHKMFLSLDSLNTDTDASVFSRHAHKTASQFVSAKRGCSSRTHLNV